MNELDTYYTDLITRYLSGETTPAEEVMLSSWIREKDENHQLFLKLKKAWELTSLSIIHEKVNIDDEWSRMMKKMPSASQQETDQKATGKVISINTNAGKTSSSNFIWKIAASLLALFALAGVLYFYLITPSVIRFTADAGSVEKVLPDGSVITLNKGASIQYASDFAKKRDIQLEGEAYFSVEHDPSSPFVVTSNGAKVEVLGTRFNVNTRNAEGNMSVVLTEGKVSLYYDDKKEDKVVLLPGEKAEISHRDHIIIKSKNSDPNYMSWKTGVIAFNDIPLGEIVRTLNNLFHTDIRLSTPGIEKCRVTATFDHQSVSSVLKVLEGTLDLNVTEQGRTILITGTACN